MFHFEGDRWLVPLLARISRRPGMYLGDERAESLCKYLLGYQQARGDAGLVPMSSEDKVLVEGFAAWLAEKTGQDQRSLSWPGLLSRIDDGNKGVGTFFRLFEEFLNGRGESMEVPNDRPFE